MNMTECTYIRHINSGDIEAVYWQGYYDAKLEFQLNDKRRMQK